VTTLRTLAARLRTAFLRRRGDRDTSEEIRGHLDLLIEEHIRRGVPPDEARDAALRSFGSLTATTEACRETRGFPALDALMQDIRYAARSARKSRGFSFVVVSCIALGVGANTAIFSIVDGILLRPLAYREPDRLVVIRTIIGQVEHLYPTVPANAPQVVRWRGESVSFEDIAAVRPETYTLTGRGEAQIVAGARVSATLLRTLGVKPLEGRFFLEDEDRPGPDDVVVLGYELWKRRFGADRRAVGATLMLDDRRYTIVGVLPASFRFPRQDQMGASLPLPPRLDVMKPLALTEREKTSFGDYSYGVIGRLRPGVTVDRSLADINAIQRRIAASIPTTSKLDLRAAVVPLHELVVGRVRQSLLLALGAVAVVLLIGCVNLAALALARAAVRLRECALRAALGATRARIMRQLLLESLILAGIGGVCGLAVARAMLDVFVAGAPVAVPRLDEVQLDVRVASFAFALTALASMLFGLAPAWRGGRSDPQRALQSSNRSATEGRAPARLRGLLIGVEVALTMALLVVAGLLVNSLVRVAQVDPGFDVQRIAVSDVTLPITRYPTTADRSRFADQLLTELTRMPGIVLPAIGSRRPLGGEAGINFLARADDVRPIFERPTGNYRTVSAGYFRALGIPLVAGRTFDESDRKRQVVVVSQRTASRLWPGEPAVGKRIRSSDTSPAVDVIGVVSDTREVDLQKDPPLMAYVPYWGRAPLALSLIVRTDAPLDHVAPQVRAAIARIDPQVPVTPVQTMEELVAAAVAPRRFQAILMAAFAGTALLLSCIGIYGALSYAVARRSGELAIRAALGAQPAQLVGQVVSSGMKPVAVGLAAGLVGALFLGKGLSSLLFGVDPRDPATILVVSVLLAVVAGAACYFPARKASHADPIAALRSE